MRIVIDMQGAQTESRFRGIGRYTMAFAQAMVRNRGDHEVLIALNGLFADTIEPIRLAFEGLLPLENIRVWQVPGSVSALDARNDARRQAAELVREAFMASLKPDVVHVTSLFEGLVDDATTSIGLFAPSIPTAVTLYDLIPYIHPKPYLENPSVAKWYREKIEHLRRAQLWFAISDSSRYEGVAHLGLPEEWVINISSDADAHFKPLDISPDAAQSIRQKYGLNRPFVMYTGSIDHRKNIEGLICAYAKLPQQLRLTHQLAIVCSAQPEQKAMLERLAMQRGMDEGELILTGYVPDDDLLALYNLCALFVFPSWHEGFGLPALEAMRCGAPVIGANTSSMPEVIGWDEALFDPRSEEAITAAILRGLTDKDFRDKLIHHGKTHAGHFSWNESARRAIAAMERFGLNQENQNAKNAGNRKQSHRLKLAYISPLPPARSGIADYSAELLPALAEFYEIEVIVDQGDVDDRWIKENCPIRTLNWFQEHHHRYDRVVYHFGNSHFHQHMFPLLDNVPGIVVLHDFFLANIQAHRDIHGAAPHAWAQSLYASHGYHAIKERYTATDTADVIWKYPANLPILQRALGIIVHSENSRELARQWYGRSAALEWRVIPLLRAAAGSFNRTALRNELGFGADDLLVCAFGHLGPTKLNHRLLHAFVASSMASNPKAHLVFVGENDGGEYGQDLLETISHCTHAAPIRITGWTDTETFRAHLAASDMAVQLRTLSRGETSAAVLDCMNYGLATIVNAHGSMADLDTNGVWMLPDAFTDEDLITALNALASDQKLRQQLGERASDIVRTQHAPSACAQMYFNAIESTYGHDKYGLLGLLPELADIRSQDHDLASLASCLANNFPPLPRQRQWLVDISALVQSDLKTGIQRVVRAILKEWLDNPPDGYRVEPVYASADSSGYRYARQFTSQFLGIADDWSQDEPAEAWPGDIFICIDLHHSVILVQKPSLWAWRNRGVNIWFVLYDLLPVLMPQFFPPEAQRQHQQWLEIISHFDGVACISRSVADEFRIWLAEQAPQHPRSLDIQWFHLGADLNTSAPTCGLPHDASRVLDVLNTRSSFLMVATVEPRKGHAQVLDAFEMLWQADANINLVIVGKQGWMVEELAERLRQHPEQNKQLFWLDSISDEYLEKVYAASTCLIAASYGEGFGLPLIEAAKHELPIIARDIPVFREVAGDHAYFFNASSPEALAQAIKSWLALYKIDQHPRSDTLPWLTWHESAQQLLGAMGLSDAAPSQFSTR